MLRIVRVWLSSALLNLSVWIGPPARLPSSSPTPRVRPPPAALPGSFEARRDVTAPEDALVMRGDRAQLSRMVDVLRAGTHKQGAVDQSGR